MALLDFGYVGRMGEDATKGPKPTTARFALAANVKDLMSKYNKGFAVGITAPEVEEGCGISAKTVRRVLDPYSDIIPNLETIDALARFFHVEAWELLRPRAPDPLVVGKERRSEKPAQPVGRRDKVRRRA